MFEAGAGALSPPIEEFGAGHIGASAGIAYSPLNRGEVYVSDLTNSDVHAFGVKVVLPKFKLVVTTPTGGEVIGSEAASEIKCGAACETEIEEGEGGSLKAERAPENEFVKWAEGPCAGETKNPCPFTMPKAEVKAAAEFGVSPKSPLTVFLTGRGAVNPPRRTSCARAKNVHRKPKAP